MTKEEIERAAVVVMESGTRIRVYPGEGFDDDCFAGEIVSPTEREMRGQGHVSCLWDCSKVADADPLPLNSSVKEGVK